MRRGDVNVLLIWFSVLIFLLVIWYVCGRAFFSVIG